jgi:hypothetical protein
MSSLALVARVTYKAEKPFGKGRSAHERHQRVVGGYRAEITDGLPDGVFAYTGVCETERAAVDELISSLKDRGLRGSLRVVR